MTSMNRPPGEVTALLVQAKRSDKEALARLMPLVYNELRRLAAHYMRWERIGHTLQPTALVHEAYLPPVGLDRLDWQDCVPFVGVTSQLMHRILINYARQRIAAQRRGAEGRADFAVPDVATGEKPEEILAMHLGVTQLAELSPEPSGAVEMRYFGGMSVEEAAEALGISPRKVKRHWALAKAWLHAELGGRGLS